MQEKVELLKELQELDQELNIIRTQRKTLEDEQAVLDADLQRVQAMVDDLSGDLQQLEVQRGELGQALAQEQDNVEKAEGRLPAIKTQKEYVAVLKEIDTAKKMNKELQDQVQAKDREIDALSRDLEEKRQELETVQAKVEGRRGEIEAELSSFGEGGGEKQASRDSLLKQLPTSMRKRYELLLERRGGVAVVEARNGACLGCNMHLPPQAFNSLFTVKEVQSCPHCNRLLYVERQQ